MDKVPGADKNTQEIICENDWSKLTFASNQRCFKSMGKVAGKDIIRTCAEQNATVLAPKDETEFTQLFEILRTVLGKVA